MRWQEIRNWIYLLVVLVTVSCGRRVSMPAGATPQPPRELANLPRAAWIKCTGDPNLDRGGVYLWQLPGIWSADNSAYQGARGESTGLLAHCTQVQVLEYAWSQMDKAFYVLVTTGELKGWVTIDLLDFTRPSSGSMTLTS